MTSASADGVAAGRPSLPITAVQHQLEHGYAWLRFEDRIEKAYWRYHQAVSLRRLRPALIIILVFGAVLVSVNYQLSPAVASAGGVLQVAAAAELAVLLLLLASWTALGQRYLKSLGLIVAATMAGMTLALGALSTVYAQPLQFAAQLLIVTCIYLLFGLRFRVAVPSGLTLTVFFALAASIAEVTPAALGNHILYLTYVNGLGAVTLYNLERSRRRDFLEEHVLQHLASRDALTGLANRQYMDETFTESWSRAADARQSIAVAIVDIDHFKRFNDEYGHQRGDECLRAVAGCLKDIASEGGHELFRYGGEEFVFLINDVGRDDIAEFGDLVCRRVEALQIMHGTSDTAPVVTVSVGVAYAMPHTATRDRGDFLHLADKALYAAKKAGRNRTILAVGGDDHDSTGVFDGGGERVDL